MNNPMSIDTPLKTDADYEAAIDRYLVAINNTLREIGKTQDETERKGKATDAKLKSIREMLNIGER